MAYQKLPMADAEDLLDDQGRESAFRRAASHTSYWLWSEAQQLANSGATGEQIAAHLGKLFDIVEQWRRGNLEEVMNNPWDSSIDSAENLLREKGIVRTEQNSEE